MGLVDLSSLPCLTNNHCHSAGKVQTCILCNSRLCCPFFFFFFKNPPCLFFYFTLYLFIYLFLAVLGLSFCARAFSSCGERGPLFIPVRGPLFIPVRGPLTIVPLRSTGSRRAGSVVAAHGPSCSTACGIFPHQGSNPCPLHWQADSQPLRHQGSPFAVLFMRSEERRVGKECRSRWSPYH